MTVDLDDPWVAAVIGRSNLADRPPANLAEHLHTVCQPMAGYTDAILEVSRVGLHKMPDGRELGTLDAILVVFPFELTLSTDKGLLKKRIDGNRVRYTDFGEAFGDQRDLGNKTGEYAIQFLGAGSVPLLRIAWGWWRGALSDGTKERLEAAKERDRLLLTIQQAIAGEFPAHDGRGLR